MDMHLFFKSIQPIVVDSDDSQSEGEVGRTDERDELERNPIFKYLIFKDFEMCISKASTLRAGGGNLTPDKPPTTAIYTYMYMYIAETDPGSWPLP